MFHLGDWLVDAATRRVSRGTDTVRLSPKAMAVLVTLNAAQGRVLTRGELLDAVWPGVTVGEEVLTHAVAELRRALGDSIRDPRFIETVHKSGYRLLTPFRGSAALDEAFATITPVDALANHPGLDDGRALNWVRETLTRATAEGGATFDLQDHALYLKASELFDRGGKQNVEDAAGLFTHLVETRPGHAAVYAGLAKTLTFIDLYFGPTRDYLTSALMLSDRAVRIDPLSIEAHSARGLALAHAGDIPGANARFETALRLQPSSAETHLLLGHASFTWGDLDLSATMLEHAARLQPEDFHALTLAAKVRWGQGDLDSAWANAAKTMARIDTHLLAYPGDFRALCGKARALVELGHVGDGLDLMAPFLKHDNPMNYFLACMLARAGETSFAIERLEECVDAGWRNATLLRRDPDLAPLHREPRFRHLAATMRAA